MGINVAQKYEKKVDERFKLKELTGHGLNEDYNWEGVDTIKVYNINTVELGDYTKSGAARFGEAAELEDTLTSYQVTTVRVAISVRLSRMGKGNEPSRNEKRFPVNRTAFWAKRNKVSLALPVLGV